MERDMVFLTCGLSWCGGILKKDVENSLSPRLIPKQYMHGTDPDQNNKAEVAELRGEPLP